MLGFLESPKPVNKEFTAVITRRQDTESKEPVYRVEVEDPQGQRTQEFRWITVRTQKGLVQLRNGSSGTGHSPFINVDRTANLAGLRKLYRWGKDDKLVRAHGFIYNLNMPSVTDELDMLSHVLITQGVHLLPQQPGETTRVPLRYIPDTQGYPMIG
jgi:hypothetical protein